MPARRGSLGGALLLAALLLAQPARAQHHHHAAATPYAGLQQRPVKAVSAEQQADLLAGRGMGLALAAELNGYPGPAHVLELAGPLALSPAQQATAQALQASMAAEARSLGAEILRAETALDRLFAEGQAEVATLAALTAEIGTLQGRLRAAHLAAHIGMHAALSPEQRASYARLRGYSR